ncbi:putative alkaline serine protease AorO [Xylariaceae sp. FL0255]|nr:putative alkaline serine protease AorO [Xylariaceae sp. FL0255]
MRCTLLLAAAAALAEVASAVPSPSGHVLHEKRDVAPKKWAKRSKVDKKMMMPMRIGMVQNNLEKGHEMLMEVSHPDSEKYGQWYEAKEIVDIFAPSKETIDAVRGWLHDAGVEAHRITLSANKQWLQFDAPAEEAERLLSTEYYIYDHVPTGKSHVAADEYHLPSHIQKYVDYVTPGLRLVAGGKTSRYSDVEKRGFKTKNTNFTGPSIIKTLEKDSLLNLTTADMLSQCDTMVTPPCIAAMYNITAATKAAPGNELGIFEEGDYYAAEDLIEFFTLFTSIPPTTEPILEGIDGGSAPSVYAGGESDLDFQISYPIVYPQQEILFQTDDIFYALGIEGGGGFFNTFLDAIDGSYCNSTAFGETGDSIIDPVYPDPIILGYQGQRQCGVYKPTNVISVSYGEQEDDLPTNYQQRQCAEIMKLGMQGVTVVFASGDSGVAARSTDDNNADGCLGNGEVFNPDVPASCPYITAVGATLLVGSAAADEETAVTRFPSGGGFSNIYPRPSYQDSAVNTYLTDHTPTYKTYNISGTNNPSESVTAGGLYNIGGRGYPDVSAVGDNVLIINNGLPTLIGGTSAAAPVFASIINRVNEERIAVGKNPVGFVNPTLYAHPEMFHDITVGNNSGCGTPGFYAASGWDPVTGLGTPNYPALLSQFMSMP